MHLCFVLKEEGDDVPPADYRQAMGWLWVNPS
jgi:hypothetical protein